MRYKGCVISYDQQNECGLIKVQVAEASKETLRNFQNGLYFQKSNYIGKEVLKEGINVSFRFEKNIKGEGGLEAKEIKCIDDTVKHIPRKIMLRKEFMSRKKYKKKKFRRRSY